MASAHGCDTAYMRCIFHALGSLYDPPNVFKHSVRKLQRASRQPFLAYICLLSVMCCQTQNTLRPQTWCQSSPPFRCRWSHKRRRARSGRRHCRTQHHSTIPVNKAAANSARCSSISSRRHAGDAGGRGSGTHTSW